MYIKIDLVDLSLHMVASVLYSLFPLCVARVAVEPRLVLSTAEVESITVLVQLEWILT